MKINPHVTPYRPAPPQSFKPADASRATAEEKLRQAIEARQDVVQSSLTDAERAPLLGKLLDLRA